MQHTEIRNFTTSVVISIKSTEIGWSSAQSPKLHGCRFKAVDEFFFFLLLFKDTLLSYSKHLRPSGIQGLPLPVISIII